MTNFGKILSHSLEFTDRLFLFARRWRYRYWFIMREGARCKSLKMGIGNCFNVPVRGEGKGRLSIGSKNNFGFRLAPLLGSGQILLQARHPESELIIGNENILGHNVSIIAANRIKIGNACRFAEQVQIFDSDFHNYHVINPAIRNTDPGLSHPVCIGNNVWLCSRVMVLKGVSIGDNVVVGAMSIVTKSIPANCIAAGNPAIIIRTISDNLNN